MSCNVVNWRLLGDILPSQKDRQKTVKLFDPRASPSPAQEVCAHSALKDSRVLWLGDSPYLLSSGADSVSISTVHVLCTPEIVWS